MDDLGMTSLDPGDWQVLVDHARTRPVVNPSSRQGVTMTAESLARAAQVLREIHDRCRRGQPAPGRPQTVLGIHPRLTARPLLFSANLLTDTHHTHRNILCRPLEPTSQQGWLVPAMARLHATGAGESIAGLTVCSHTTIRNTSLDVRVDRPLGYIGPRPQVTTPAWSDGDAERNLERALGPLVADTAVHQPGDLTGAGAARMARRASDDPTLANGPVTMKVLPGAVRRSHATVSVGTLSACLTPTGGLCGGTTEANHWLCQLGCPNMVLTPQHRARLELMRCAGRWTASSAPTRISQPRSTPTTTSLAPNGP